MKQLLTLILILLGSVIYSQIDLYADYREFCIYNERTESFSTCIDKNENSVFKFNKDATIFTHQIDSLSRTYYVKDTDHDESKGDFMYYCEANNIEYIVQINLETNIIRIIEANYVQTSQVCLIRYYISEIDNY